MNLFNNYGVKVATLVSFSFFGVMPATARETSMLKLAVNKYNVASKAYAEKGPEAFIAQYKELPKADQHAFLKLLHGTPALPVAEVKGDKIVLSAEGESHTIEVADASTGDFLMDGKAFHYDAAAGLQSNVNKLQTLMGQKTVSLMDLLIPSANAALGAIGWAVIAGLVFGGLVWFFKSSHDKKQKVKDGLRDAVEHDPAHRAFKEATDND